MKVIADEDDDSEDGEQTARQGKVSWILRALDLIQTWPIKMASGSWCMA